MTWSLRLALGLCLAVALLPSRAEARGPFLWTWPHRESDKDAIHDLVDHSTQAWNAGDAEGYAVRFVVDLEFTDVTGFSSSGRKTFEARQNQLFKTIFRGSRLKQVIQKVRLLTPEVAMIEIDTELTGFAGLPGGVRAWPDGVLRTHLQEVLVKVAGTWWIAGYHEVDAKPDLGG